MADPRPAMLGALLESARRQLTEASIDDPGLASRLIVEHFTGTTRTDAIAAPEQPVEAGKAEAALAAVAECASGKPVHRLLGYRYFYGIKLNLSGETLEPRPDTETLVELVLPEARRMVRENGRCRILDLGTGTGAVALALLSQVPDAEAVGTDISADALATAHRNADINGCENRFTTLQSNWFSSVDGYFELIVSNPPYIASAALETLPPNVQEHDPAAALDGGLDGLEPYRRIAAGAGEHLAREGLIAVETGYDQRTAVTKIFASQGFEVLNTARDLGGRHRAIIFSRESAA